MKQYVNALDISSKTHLYTTVRRIVTNLSAMSVAHILSQFLLLGAAIYLARVFGAEGYGILGFAIAIVSYFNLIVNAGFSIYGTREIARNREQLQQTTSAIITIRLGLSFVSFGLLTLLVFLLPKLAEVQFVILLYGLTIFSIPFTLDWVFKGTEEMGKVALAQILQAVLYILGIFLWIHDRDQVWQVPLIQIISLIIVAGVYIFLFYRGFGKWWLCLESSIWRGILRHSLPMGFSLAMIQVYHNLDKVMLGFMKGEEVVGWYSAAYLVANMALAIPNLFFTAFFPTLSKYYRDNQDQLATFARYYVRTLICLGIPFGIGGVLLASHLVYFIFGTAYSNSVLALQVLSWNITMVFINMAYGNPLLAWDHERRYMIAIAAGALTNLVMNFILIPYLSLTGAAIATLLAEIVVFFGLYPAFQQIIRAPVLTYCIKPVLCTIGMAIAIWWMLKITDNIFALLSLGALSYFGLIAISSLNLKRMRALLGLI